MARGGIVEVSERPQRQARGQQQARAGVPPPSFVVGNLQRHQQRAPGAPLPSGAAAFMAQAPARYSAEEGRRQMQAMVSHALAAMTGEGTDEVAARARRKREREAAARRIPLNITETMRRDLDPAQLRLLELVRDGQSVVLLGRAGTGKTHALTEGLMAALRASGISYACTGSTGRAAAHLGGTTLHHLVGMGLLKNQRMDQILKRVRSAAYLRERWQSLRVLIVDEFTMLSADDMEKVEAVARAAREGARSESMFGGLVVVLCGDPCQLQCVDDDHTGAQPLFMSSFLARIAPSLLLLRTVHRQRDASFCAMLDDVRAGRVTDRVRVILEARYRAPLPAHAMPVKLCARRADVEAANENAIRALGGKPLSFVARLSVAADRVLRSPGSPFVKRHREILLPGSETYRAAAYGSSSDSDEVAVRGTVSYTAHDTRGRGRRSTDLSDHVSECDWSGLERTDVSAMHAADRVLREGNLRPRVILRVGAPVMLVRNVPGMVEWGLVNGATGVVVGFVQGDRGQEQEYASEPCPPVPEDAHAHMRTDFEDHDTSTSPRRSRGKKASSAFSAALLPQRQSHGALNLTAHFDADLAMPLGDHPWREGAKCARFVKKPNNAGFSWPVVEFADVGRFICAPLALDVDLGSLRDGAEGNRILIIEQIPLLAAAAITVHKAQGMTLNHVSIQLDHTMNQPNQVYVALSRASSEEGLTLSSLQYDAIKAEPRAAAFMEAAEEIADSQCGSAQTRDVLARAKDIWKAKAAEIEMSEV